MTVYRITGTVPTPRNAEGKAVGTVGRMVSVTTSSVPVGKQLVKVFQTLFNDVSVSKKEIA